MNTESSLVSFRGEYQLIRKEKLSENPAPQKFTHPHPSGRTVEAVVSYVSENVLAQVEGVGVPNSILSKLRTLGPLDGPKLSEEEKKILRPPIEEMRQTVRRILALIKYHLLHSEIGEALSCVKKEEWRLGEEEWRPFPLTGTMTASLSANQPLNEATRNLIQQSLTAEILPLTAMRHLHRAKHEDQPHHKWIDATIAAELAVKEVLCRANPAVEQLLIELPSPPIYKLYGPLLKHYLGEKSPFLNELKEGQERRNKLVHRPSAESVGLKEAKQYVTNVEAAIFHLLSLLYPKDRLIQDAKGLLTIRFVSIPPQQGQAAPNKSQPNSNH
ncbi:MAG: hypothetical protein QM760_11605 [Nibricoccus sp.]